jgi:hypothetical protein
MVYALTTGFGHNTKNLWQVRGLIAPRFRPGLYGAR